MLTNKSSIYLSTYNGQNKLVFHPNELVSPKLVYKNRPIFWMKSFFRIEIFKEIVK